ncbi:MAG: hypothetical protein KatS3mg010_0345 [Acidimicrobiia bacterium]|nr:MAG: hypothetical protein KatS3mg010_0345 [Acidimicrobiia bacterium]
MTGEHTVGPVHMTSTSAWEIGREPRQVGRRERPDVLRRADAQRRAVVAGAQRVEQEGGERGLAGREPRLRRDVVEEQPEPRDAGVEQRGELVDEQGAVARRLVADVEPG